MNNDYAGRDIYRLKYKDADGVSSDRQIEIKSIMRGDNPSNSYIFAFCHSADDFRQFRFDRIKALYNSDGKIIDPYNFIKGKYKDYESSDDPRRNTTALANEALSDSNKSKPENKKANSEIKDIPTLKKMRKGFRITSIVLALLGIISISTIILPILFFGGMVFFLIAAWGTKNQIKELETAQAQNSKT